MSTEQHLFATLPLPKGVSGESFIDEEELGSKILCDIQQREGKEALSATLKIRKRRGEEEEEPIIKRWKEEPSRDSLPTAWKAGFYVKGPLKIRWRERLVREHKYKISFNTSSQSINGVKKRMSRKGWDLKYTTVSNSDGLIVKIPSEFGHSIHSILEDLNRKLAMETEADLRDDTDRTGREGVEAERETSRQ
ncbi:Fc.00g081610.m01.CDS01 [Cosmosporella sp. VM-42]